MKVKWLQKFDNKKKDSIWYGGDIVTVDLGRYQVTIGAYGDIRAFINGEYYCDKCNDGCFEEYLEEQGIHNDEELSDAIQNGKITFENNNWFEAVIWDKEEKEYIETYDTIDEFDENDNFDWLKEWVEEIVE